jgi:hypothetical protein
MSGTSGWNIAGFVFTASTLVWHLGIFFREASHAQTEIRKYALFPYSLFFNPPEALALSIASAEIFTTKHRAPWRWKEIALFLAQPYHDRKKKRKKKPTSSADQRFLHG